MGCHALPQGIFPTQGSNLFLMSPALAGRFFTTDVTWEPPGNTEDVFLIQPDWDQLQ